MHQRKQILRALFATVLVTTAACHPKARESVAMESRADSIVLERRPGFSPLPAYRVSISSTGQVNFERLPSYRSSPGQLAARDSLAPVTFQQLLRRAESNEFFSMQSLVAGNPGCLTAMTDQATIAITVFQPSRTKRVNIYSGCAMPSDFLAFAGEIDRITRTSQWLYPQR
jgi:hypothetical protein